MRNAGGLLRIAPRWSDLSDVISSMVTCKLRAAGPGAQKEANRPCVQNLSWYIPISGAKASQSRIDFGCMPPWTKEKNTQEARALASPPTHPVHMLLWAAMHVSAEFTKRKEANRATASFFCPGFSPGFYVSTTPLVS